MVNDRAGVVLDRLRVEFDDERAVSNAGLLLPATLAARLGIERLVDETVDLGDRPGAVRPGRKVLTLCHAMLLGADSIDDCDLLRSGRTSLVAGHRVLAPSTLGTFLRSFSFGHVRQLDRVLAESVARAWQVGAGPGKERLVIDLDSFVGEVHGYRKQGAAYGYTRMLGYHPLLATRAGTEEALHVRLRKGSANTQRGASRFVDELIARVRRAGAAGEILLRADSGFWNKKITGKLRAKGCLYSIGVRAQANVVAAIDAIPEQAWQPLPDYPDSGEAEIAETTLGEDRLIVRRVRTLDAQQQLFATWQHFAFISNRDEPLELVEREHREHASVELVIRDLKDQALRHFPSGRFNANAAWTVIACLAHNLLRWSELLGLPEQRPRRARTLRRRLLALPGRLTHSARRWTLHLPARWPWQTDYTDALTRIRALTPPG
ncbi:MAG TPA: IS1380 family transposase [Thermomicrobiaceae bacterium]|nr:IS1380 family transposase [Thermomicrobiaceae bacterium]